MTPYQAMLHPSGATVNIRKATSTTPGTLAFSVKRGNPIRVTVHTMGIFANGYAWHEFRYKGETFYVTGKFSVLKPVKSDNTINLIPYMFPQDHKTWKLTTGEILYGRYDGKRMRLCKGFPGGLANWEGFWTDGQYIYRDIDTSPGKREGRDAFYLVTDSIDKNRTGAHGVGQPWIPVEMAIGDEFERDTYVENRFKDDGNFTNQYSGYLPMTIKLHARHDRYMINGHEFQDVLEFWGLFGHEKKHEETWRVALGYGYFLEWERVSDGHKSSFVEDVPDNLRSHPQDFPNMMRYFNWNPQGAIDAKQSRDNTPDTPVELIPDPTPPPSPEPEISLFDELGRIKNQLDQLSIDILGLQIEFGDK